MSFQSAQRLLFGHGKNSKICFTIFLWLLLHVMNGYEGASIPKLHYLHRNLCKHIVPEPKVDLSNMFDTTDYFFPQYYIERKCASPVSKKGSSQPSWATCLNGQYHCVTRYRMIQFLRMPNSLNGTLANASIEVVPVPVACECSSFMIK